MKNIFRIAFAVSFYVLSGVGTIKAQSAAIIPGPWPNWSACTYAPPITDAFQILFDATGGLCAPVTDAALRVSVGNLSTTTIFGQLGVEDINHQFWVGTPNTKWFTGISFGTSGSTTNLPTVLRSSWGDLVLTATTSQAPPRGGPTPPPTASIHFGTTISGPLSPSPAEIPNDVERMSIWDSGKVAIGTQGTFAKNILGGENDLLHLHLPCLPLSYTPLTTYNSNQLMAIKLSYGNITDPQLPYSQIGFDPGTTLSTVSVGQDLVIRTSPDILNAPEQVGNIVIANERHGKSINLTTTSASMGGAPNTPVDQERMTIAGNGNVGIDLPSWTSPAPWDQVQIGGGPNIPGLTIYGGNAFEGTSTYPVDWRYIGFNFATNHSEPSSVNKEKIVPDASSWMWFSDASGGLLGLGTSPDLNDMNGGVTMLCMGSKGIETFCDQSVPPNTGPQYYHLFELWRPGYGGQGWGGGMDVTNPNGVFFHHTPVYIGGQENPNFLDPSFQIQPTMGTWQLVVNGPVLAQEVFVETGWPDYVFNREYHLRPLSEVAEYVSKNRHLPDIPSQGDVAKNGVPIGSTEAKLLQKIEELTLYVIQSDKTIQELKVRLSALEAKVLPK